MRTSQFALLGVAMLVWTALGPGAAAADAASGNEAADGALAVSVDDLVVTVTENATAVENATVNVSAAGNLTYAGDGTHVTAENGTVSLAAPEETVTLSVTATADGETVSTTADVVAGESEAVTKSFGTRVAASVHELIKRGDVHTGPQVAEYVTSNDPGNPPAHAGPPTHAGPGNETGENRTQGPPGHAGGPPAHAGK